MYSFRVDGFYLICFSPSGTKHFLLICNVKAEDAGEVHFVARDVESTAYLEVEGESISYLLVLL